MNQPKKPNLDEMVREALQFYAPGAVGTAEIRNFLDWAHKIKPLEAEITAAANQLVMSGFAVSTSEGWQISSAA